MTIKIVSSSVSEELSPQDIQTASALGFDKWLPFAAKEYNISANPKDYLLKPVNIMITELPNRNGVGFSSYELAKWNSEYKCMAYETWRRAPMFVEHKSDQIKTAVGVIIDVAMKKVVGFGQDKLYKIVCLAAIDRTKNPEVAAKLESGALNSFSMGAMVQKYTCSVCDAEIDKCSHISSSNQIDFYERGGQLAYRIVHGIVGYELSVVADPAYAVALSDYTMKF